MPALSVIVPVYNTEKYLHECIDSILQQSYKDFELILIDDGSTDNSLFICNEYAENNSNILVLTQNNQGPGMARNLGIENASGDFIAFVDSDDFLNQYAFSTAMSLFADGVDIVQFSFSQFKDGEKPYRCTPKNNAGTNMLTIEQTNIEALYYLLDIWHMDNRFRNSAYMAAVVWSKICRKELFNDVSFPDSKAYEDTKVVHHLLANARKIVCTNLELYNYRIRMDSATHSVDRNNKQMREARLSALTDRFMLMEKLGNDELAYLAARQCLTASVNDYSNSESNDRKVIILYARKVYVSARKCFKVIQKLVWGVTAFFQKHFA